MKKGHFLLSIAFAAIVSAAVSVGVVHYTSYKNQNMAYESFSDLENNSNAHLTSFNSFQAAVPHGLDLTKAAESSLEGVVLICNFQQVNSRSKRDPFLEQFFGGSQNPSDGTDDVQLAGIGSGVIIYPDGYITTNNHVVHGAAKLEVTLSNNLKYTAKLVGVDPTTDLALLKIEEESLRFISFGSSDDTKVGEWVLAVGHPYNLGSTVTAGIISAKARSIGILRQNNLAIESFIQTDAAVNPGNSGGALVNIRGELIGINSAIASPTGSFAGYSFAVPSAIVKKVMDDLKEFGTVQRALLGVSIKDVSADMVKAKSLDVDRGVYISATNATGAAAEAGLKPGDVIIKVDDRKVDNSSQLQEYLGRFRPGDKVKVTFKRGKEIKTTTITLKNKVGSTEVVKRSDKAIVSSFGADLQPLSKSELTSLGISSGVRVVRVGGGKFAHSGMSDGFIITKIEKHGITTPRDVTNILSGYSGGILIEGMYPDGTQAYYGFGW
jgi:serine protease Do